MLNRSRSERSFGIVVVCYGPPADLADRLPRLLDQTPHLVLVDNGPAEEQAQRGAEYASFASDRFTWIRNPRNEGIAKALNQGVRHLQSLGLHWALTLDHDSMPIGSMIDTLLDQADQAAHTDVAAFVPRVRYQLADVECRWPVTSGRCRLRFKLTYANRMTGPTAVDLAISSGMLLSVKSWAEIGGFREGLFMDLVDTEYCLRARHHGQRIIAVPRAELQHAIGNMERRSMLGLLKAYPTHHAAIRHYYLARNRVFLWKAHGRRFPSWAAYELISGAKLLAKSLAYEPDRWTKLKVTVRGTYDGLMTRVPPLQGGGAAATRRD